MNAATFKVVLTGDSGVGKTAIVLRYIEDIFDSQMSQTVGVSFKKKTVNVQNREATLIFWDTAGQEVYRSLAPQYYRDAAMALVVFAVNEQSSLAGAREWIKGIREQQPTAVVMLVGNKTDLDNERVVSQEAAAELAEEFGLKYMETSALRGDGIKEVFEELVSDYFKSLESQKDESEQVEPRPAEQSSSSVNLSQPEEKHRKKCC